MLPVTSTTTSLEYRPLQWTGTLKREVVLLLSCYITTLIFLFIFVIIIIIISISTEMPGTR